MELASEDAFRLNVMLANKPLAIRIDESRLNVHALAGDGEIKVSLNPSAAPDAYVRKVRELISGHILGSPGGYPVYLRRWTRMGQMRDESLEQLLMLGEPEAVVAAVCSPGLTNELARRAWWAMEDAENARRMLENPAIAGADMGPVLAAYLIEYLPFETEPEPMMRSVRLVLQPGLIDEDVRAELWKKSARKQAYQVGFLQGDPDGVPAKAAARADLAEHRETLGPLAAEGNAVAACLLRVLDGPGQAFIETVSGVLKKPPNQDVVLAVFDVLREYLSPLRPDGQGDLAIAELIDEAQALLQGDRTPANIAACLDAAPGLSDELAAMRVLGGLGYGSVRPVLNDPTALGTLMRRKLAPLLEPVDQRLGLLRGKGGSEAPPRR